MGIFRNKLQFVPPETIEELKSDILTSGKPLKELADKHQMFYNDVLAVAKGMGITTLDTTTFYAPNNIIKDPIVIPTKVIEPSKPHRKSRTVLTPALKEAVMTALKAEQKDNWCHFNRAEFSAKFDISVASLSRIAEENNFIIGSPLATEDKKDETSVLVPTIEFKKIEDSELVPLSPSKSINSISAKIDNSISINGINFFIFDKDVSKLTRDYDFETPIKKYFDKYIKDKEINQLKVYFKPNVVTNISIIALLTKYCMINNCNFSYIEMGYPEVELVNCFNGGANKNLSKIMEKLDKEDKIYLYKTSEDDLTKSADIYYTYSFHTLVLSDTVDKMLEYIARYQKGVLNVSNETKAFRVNSGNRRLLFTIGNQPSTNH